MSSTIDFARRNFQGTRVLITSARGYDETLTGLKERMGVGTVAQIVTLAADAPDAAEFERPVKQQFLGSSGLTLFAEIDRGSWISIYGIQRRTLRIILGNPLIAINDDPRRPFRRLVRACRAAPDGSDRWAELHVPLRPAPAALHCSSIISGGTEFSLLLREGEIEAPLIDCAKDHVAALVACATSTVATAGGDHS